jgi:hypothetical protein
MAGTYYVELINPKGPATVMVERRTTEEAATGFFGAILKALAGFFAGLSGKVNG